MNYGFDDSKSKVNMDTQIDEKIANKVDKVEGKGLSTNDFTDALKTKLDKAITIVDTALSSTSVNPVQNKVINTALSNKVDKVSGKGLSTYDFTAAYRTYVLESAYNTTTGIIEKTISADGINYYTYSKPYTCPHDGYVTLTSNSDEALLRIRGTAGSANPVQAACIGPNQGDSVIFVKKGMKIYGTTIGSGDSVDYYALTSYS